MDYILRYNFCFSICVRSTRGALKKGKKGKGKKGSKKKSAKKKKGSKKKKFESKNNVINNFFGRAISLSAKTIVNVHFVSI